MGSSFNLDFVRSQWGPDETSALRSMANSEGCYRIYKLGQKGREWTHYKPIDDPEEESIIARSSWGSWDYVLLVYSRGEVVNVDNLWEKSPLVAKKKLWQFWK